MPSLSRISRNPKSIPRALSPSISSNTTHFPPGYCDFRSHNNAASKDIGVTIVPALTGADFPSFDWKEYLAVAQGNFSHAAAIALSRDTDRDQCWLFSGESGSLGISLAVRTVPTAVVIEQSDFLSGSEGRHNKQIHWNPRVMVVYGLLDDVPNMFKLKEEKLMTLLARLPPFPPGLAQAWPGIHVPVAMFEYDFDGSSRQSFTVSKEIVEWGIDFGTIILNIDVNWGGPSTALCGFEMYGNNA
ncbi:hypothetical protein EWM64_g2956 [Hericium alpestre]|uniref:SUN domain-containing protein n=1 Tax=Hericium alpestre TaxID=135208 RepID=A0A4Z0A3M6_9AGAM|nr:hypothetical protein EWM64_g2956 [Hericium alpestre]